MEQFPEVKMQLIPFRGGLDTETPALLKRDGVARDAQNYECSISGGYNTVWGYERYDGQAKPSDANYAIINVTITGSFAAGNTITGVTSGATAVVIAVVTSTTPDYLAITKIVGTFNSSETLNVSGSPQGTTSSTATVDGASTVLLHAQYKNLAADRYRSDIAAIPGSGSVLGIVRLNDVLYGFRNNAGGTAAAIYKSTSSGWSLVPLLYELSFTAGSVAPAEGGSITQGGVAAVVRRVVLQSGTWAGGTAAGRFIISAPTGGNFAAGALGGATTATASGIQTAITILPGGRYSFDIYNFTGSTSTSRIYGADGVNRAFEFDGTYYVPITTGMASDTPLHIKGHKNHLFLSFLGSVQHSSLGLPYQWSVVTGAAELGMGDNVTGFATQTGGDTTAALAIFSRNKTTILYGTSSANWNIVTNSEEVGAYPYTIQNTPVTMSFDDRGVSLLQATQDYGNFDSNSVSAHIRTWTNARRTSSRASCICRDKSQYRIFFTDNSALFVTVVNGKVIGMLPILYASAIKCAWSSEDSDGTEVMYFGSDDGMVYQMDKGTSFDGANIEAWITLAYTFSKSPRTRKRYRKAMLEVNGSGYAEFGFTYQLGYNSTDIPQPGTENIITSFSSVYWDSFTWDAFIWDGVTLSPSEAQLSGTAENISLIINSSSDYYSPLTFSGAVIHYSHRRQLR